MGLLVFVAIVAGVYFFLRNKNVGPVNEYYIGKKDLITGRFVYVSAFDGIAGKHFYTEEESKKMIYKEYDTAVRLKNLIPENSTSEVVLMQRVNKRIGFEWKKVG